MMFTEPLMEVICERENLFQALRRVRRNKGSPGVDGMSVDELAGYLKEHWPSIRERLLQGEYLPEPVRRVEIPKPGKPGQTRLLGIPTVVDRLIQQAILQVLQSRWDASFSEQCYGFRKGRSAHQAIAQAQSYVKEGYVVVVDIDLKSFFDHVNHDRLMSRLAAEIADKRLLKLIRRYLQCGLMENGVVKARSEGTPQGGPLSPFLSNVVLDEWDRELERRGHRFVRYGDDCNIFVRSQRAGERVMASSRRFLTERLKLQVNESKSAVDEASNRSFLGFTLTSSLYSYKRQIAPESLLRFKSQVRSLTRRQTGISLRVRLDRLSEYLRGWLAYFGFCEARSILDRLDGWIRRRLRSVIWCHWKTHQRRVKALRKLGLSEDLIQLTMRSGKGAWMMSRVPGIHKALGVEFFDRCGLPRLNQRL